MTTVEERTKNIRIWNTKKNQKKTKKTPVAQQLEDSRDNESFRLTIRAPFTSRLEDIETN